MFTKHFFKTLIIFSSLIILGLLGVIFAGYLDDRNTGVQDSEEVAN